MSERDEDRRKDLTEGWPEEPGNEDLARFAEGLRAARPALSAEALARVGRAMAKEMDAAPPKVRRLPLFLAAGMAASVLLAVTGYIAFRSWPPEATPEKPPETAIVSPEPARVEGMIPVNFAALRAQAPAGRALLRVEEYRGLFTN